MSKYHYYLENSACKKTFNRLLLTCCGYLALLGVICHQGKVMADVLVYEPFAYVDEWLTGQDGASGTTGTWTAYDTLHGSFND